MRAWSEREAGPGDSVTRRGRVSAGGFAHSRVEKVLGISVVMGWLRLGGGLALRIFEEVRS
jgi:hypothetical protein